jgi:mono/diheme cytochrome c family protein
VLAAFLLTSCGGSEKPTETDNTETQSSGVQKKVEEASNSAGSKVDQAKEKAGVVVSEAKAAAAKQLFSSFCSTCHGTEGKGDGPAVTPLMDPKPASFANATWQDSVTDEHLLLVIREGGAAAGKSQLMVAAPGAKDDPELAQALLDIVRSYRP